MQISVPTTNKETIKALFNDYVNKYGRLYCFSLGYKGYIVSNKKTTHTNTSFGGSKNDFSLDGSG